MNAIITNPVIVLITLKPGVFSAKLSLLAYLERILNLELQYILHQFPQIFDYVGY